MLVAYIGADDVDILSTPGKLSIISIWRSVYVELFGYRWAIVQDSNAHGYVAINLGNITFTGLTKKFHGCQEFEDLDQAIMACSMGAVG